MTLPDLEAMALFAKVVEQRSFTRAAAELNLSKATVSKTIDRLEQRLGARLFHRTTRSLTLTATGQILAERAAAILNAGEEAEDLILSQSAAPRGRVRLTVPMSFGLRHVSPLIPDFLAAYPEVRIEIDFSDAPVDLVKQGFDAALRIAALPDSSLMARRIRSVKTYILASPEALAHFGTPAHPLALAGKPCLCYTHDMTVLPWQFHRGAEAATIRPDGPLHVNNGEAVMAGLIAGQGFGLLPDFLADDALTAGKLVVVLPDWSLPASALHFVTPPGARPKRVEVLGQFFVDRLRRKH